MDRPLPTVPHIAIVTRCWVGVVGGSDAFVAGHVVQLQVWYSITAAAMNCLPATCNEIQLGVCLITSSACTLGRFLNSAQTPLAGGRQGRLAISRHSLGYYECSSGVCQNI